MKKEKLESLKYYDIIFITLLMFGSAIYSSALGYSELIRGVSSIGENLYFSDMDNWISITEEVVKLAIIFIYLYIRKFDFKRWRYSINWKVILYGIGIYIAASLIMDLSSFTFGFNVFPLEYTGKYIMIGELWDEISTSLIIFSIINGFFEEIFFLGICMSVNKSYRIHSLIYSVIIRTAIHTYQGMASAMTIGIGIGLLFYFAYRRNNKNLTPVITAHILSDIFGVGILGLILY